MHCETMRSSAIVSTVENDEDESIYEDCVQWPSKVVNRTSPGGNTASQNVSHSSSSSRRQTSSTPQPTRRQNDRHQSSGNAVKNTKPRRSQDDGEEDSLTPPGTLFAFDRAKIVRPTPVDKGSVPMQNNDDLPPAAPTTGPAFFPPPKTSPSNQQHRRSSDGHDARPPSGQTGPTLPTSKIRRHPSMAKSGEDDDKPPAAPAGPSFPSSRRQQQNHRKEPTPMMPQDGRHNQIPDKDRSQSSRSSLGVDSQRKQQLHRKDATAMNGQNGRYGHPNPEKDMSQRSSRSSLSAYSKKSVADQHDHQRDQPQKPKRTAKDETIQLIAREIVNSFQEVGINEADDAIDEIMKRGEERRKIYYDQKQKEEKEQQQRGNKASNMNSNNEEQHRRPQQQQQQQQPQQQRMPNGDQNQGNFVPVSPPPRSSVQGRDPKPLIYDLQDRVESGGTPKPMIAKPKASVQGMPFEPLGQQRPTRQQQLQGYSSDKRNLNSPDNDVAELSMEEIKRGVMEQIPQSIKNQIPEEGWNQIFAQPSMGAISEETSKSSTTMTSAQQLQQRRRHQQRRVDPALVSPAVKGHSSSSKRKDAWRRDDDDSDVAALVDKLNIIVGSSGSSDSGGEELDDLSECSDLTGLTGAFTETSSKYLGGSAWSFYSNADTRTKTSKISRPAASPPPSRPDSPTVCKTPESSSRRQRKQLSVSFKKVQVRYYEIIPTDNPAVQSGPAIGIGWKYQKGSTMYVDEYEAMKLEMSGGKPPRKSYALVMPREVRVAILKELGYTEKEVSSMIRKILRTKNQRRQTVNNLGVAGIAGMEEAIENAKKKVFNLVMPFGGSGGGGVRLQEQPKEKRDKTKTASEKKKQGKSKRLSTKVALENNKDLDVLTNEARLLQHVKRVSLSQAKNIDK